MGSMHIINAEGRRCSILNDDSISHTRPAMPWSAVSYPSYGNYRTSSSSPNTPELLRSESYDSQMSNEPVSPTTPVFGYGHYPEGRTPYEEYPDYASSYVKGSRAHYSGSRAGSYDAESVTGMPTGDKAAKRYPCRYKDSHRCDKTFTTSGHASRHSKIHTAEKAVPCTFEGCTKKFTRADNMKQHLDTHYKEKHSRHSASSKAKVKAVLEADACWDMSGLCLPLQRRPSLARNPSAGLDALAMAVACQREA